ncbi:MAG: sigma-54-dependent Fis family transcriptional regulator [Deltaproteobacteria bacterium]|nr:sigma-54-dependent Fis family transcriptional regulator [Deltaproteobacteria bacterium]
MSGRVLIVDDDSTTSEMLATALTERGMDAGWRSNAEDALLAFAAEDFGAVVTDLNMEGMNGLELCERIVANRPEVPVIVITAFGSTQAAVAAIRAGAYDFIAKPVDTDALVLTVERALRHRSLRDEVKRLRQAVADSQHFEELIGPSPAMRRVQDLVARVADSDASVLITGESGTGKELVARALHARSARRDGPFVPVNCAAMPEPLLESELFGHVKGAFTDAKSARTGLFVQASGGTLFLDEIGEMATGMQAKLLRSLQEHKVRPVGGNSEVTFDARLLTATNRDLEGLVEERAFREDLYYRINVVHIQVPPLRARGTDVLPLAQSFVERFARTSGKHVIGLSSSAAEKLLGYDWPGNVRELENCIERAVVLARHEQIAVDDLPEKIRDYRSSHIVVASDDPSQLLPMHEVERRYILRVLKAVGGNKTEAARVLGFDRRTLYRRLERYGMPDVSGAADLEMPLSSERATGGSV